MTPAVRSATGARRPVAERRLQLLDAAVEVMAEGGFRAATTRSITMRAGLPHGVFHYCFDSKADLFKALLDREIAETRTRNDQGLREDRGFRGWLTATLTQRLERSISNYKRTLVLAEFAQFGRTDESIAALLRWEHDRYTQLVTDDVRRRVPGLAPERLKAVAQLLIASITGITDTWLITKDDDGARLATGLLAEAIASAVELPTS